ncbi:hypothetical protein FSP39_005328 [Pinctada imbricata]|uniref:Uncharacterized protein n=1 Tax=Pinctada imbricata TaxID=66713 RepID=A0AA88Y4Z3_PINIB|nr:hypothetical protein FSP39_005328 [Pinctada imbricata]
MKIVQETTQDALPDSSKTDGGVVTEKADSEMTDGDINSGKVASVMGDEQTHSEKADSGMDDDSQHSNESNTQQSVGTSNDSEDDDDDVVVRRPPKIKNVFNSDIFDAEEDSDDDDNMTPKDDRGSENKDKTEHRDSDDSENEDKSTQRDSGDESASDSDKSNNDSDEGFNENDIDPKLLKKLKKGASKKPTSQRRAAQESLMAIHSETQRIVRESRVNLPYHQPEPKPLSAFLERASKKRESYRTVLHSRDIHKAKAMQDVFEKTRLQAKSQKAPAIVMPEEKRKDEDCDDEKTEVRPNVLVHRRQRQNLTH